jgi:hypothetical protein
MYESPTTFAAKLLLKAIEKLEKHLNNTRTTPGSPA